MNRWLCISVAFLTGRFHGQDEDGEPEWPPSPLRLFQALLAGSTTGVHGAAWSDAEEQAFSWLEQREPPQIVAARTTELSPRAIAVPNNDLDVVAREWSRGKLDGTSPAALKTMKRLLPQQVGDGEESVTVHYLWPCRMEDEGPVMVLLLAARRLLALGHGTDLVAGHGALLDDGAVVRLAGERWRPGDGVTELRVPCQGTLASLRARHQAFLGRLTGDTINLALPPLQSRPAGYLGEGELPRRPYAAFRMVDKTWADDRPQLWPQRTLCHVAGMARHLAIAVATQDGKPAQWIERFVAGHGTTGDEKEVRFSYLPLPSIGHQHADGEVRRLLIAGPLGGSADDSDWVRARCDGGVLREEQTGREVALLSAIPADGVINCYTGRARRWTTVTPVVLPGHDDRSFDKAMALMERALLQAGIRQQVTDFSLQRVPFRPGGLPATGYEVPRYLKGYGRWHAVLTFKSKVKGPITVGAGRHVGLGLFAVDDRGQQPLPASRAAR